MILDLSLVGTAREKLAYKSTCRSRRREKGRWGDGEKRREEGKGVGKVDLSLVWRGRDLVYSRRLGSIVSVRALYLNVNYFTLIRFSM